MTHAPIGSITARLMQAASGRVLCDEAVYQAARSHLSFEPLPPITVKGKAEPVAVYRPTGRNAQQSVLNGLIDRLSPAQQLTLKVASVIGHVFAFNLLRDTYPVEADKTQLGEHLRVLEQLDLVAQHSPAPELSYRFKEEAIQETAYNVMLFAQRRQLHRAVAEW